jgi:predicted Fe-S protein YdhL (DUF1289 family)
MKRIESPCVGRCGLNKNDICIGCWRSLEEIKVWAQADEEIKKEILMRVKCRQFS